MKGLSRLCIAILLLISKSLSTDIRTKAFCEYSGIITNTDILPTLTDCSTLRGNIRIRGNVDEEELTTAFSNTYHFQSVVQIIGCITIEKTMLKKINFLRGDHALRIVRNRFLESIKLHERVIFDVETTNYNSYPSPFTIHLSNNITDGYGLIVKGWTLSNPENLIIELYNRDFYDSERPLHISVRFRNSLIVVNSMIDSKWGTEENKPCTVKLGESFDIRILIIKSGFEIYVDQKKIMDFAHRLPHTVISSAIVRGELLYLERLYWALPTYETIYDDGKHLLLIRKNKELREKRITPEWLSNVSQSLDPGGYVNDKFLNDLESDCTVIDGDLIISNLKNAGLEIWGNKYMSLLGLSNLSRVEVPPEAEYSIIIENNDNLKLSEQERVKLESLGNGRAMINVTMSTDEREEKTMASNSEGFPYVAVAAVVLLSLFPFTVGAIIVYLRLKKAKKEQENEHKRVKELAQELEINQRKMDRMEDEKRNQGKLLHHYAAKHEERETSEIVDEMLNSGQSAKPFVT
uniref:Galectin n=1 Tax=Heterorhabditis bacteriophora TaxID=37862 RepID=A0A1I7WLP7_HETBA